MSKKNPIITAAHVISGILSPMLMPTIALLALYAFSYLSHQSWWAKIAILVIVIAMTIMVPWALITLYRNYNKKNNIAPLRREQHTIPYVIAILCYSCCYYIIQLYHIPHTVGNVLVAAMMILVACAIVNIWWKVSVHTAAMGGMVGGVAAFSSIFSFNPLWWLCLLILLSGLSGTSRMILRQHTLSQITVGFLLGMVCAYISVIVV